MSNRIFSTVRSKRPRRNVFDLSHQVKLSANMGKLVPFLCQEIVPGDKFQVSTEVFLRFAPMVAPVMHNVNVYTHFFFVPNRLVWDNWENFITGGKNGDLAPPFPQFNVPASVINANPELFKSGSLMDYMGVAPFSADDVSSPSALLDDVSALPFRAYQLIYNEYYRDQNLSDPIDIDLGDGIVTDPLNLLTLRNRAWEKDYFTSALPWAQRGGDVSLPLGNTAPVRLTDDPNNQWFEKNDGSAFVDGSNASWLRQSAITPGDRHGKLTDGTSPSRFNPGTSLEADLTDASGATINDLRRSIRLQEWLEKNARGGARYVEQILAHFGVRSSDARLQRPEYLGGGKQPVVISEVLQTSSTDANSPQANPAGVGYSVGSSNRFKRFFEEHGYIIGIMSVLPRTAYQQGVPRHFRKFDKLDFYFPEFANLGEQEIYNSELYYNHLLPSKPTNNSTFGYTPRYAEYKNCESRVCGDFRDTLSFWTMSRIFPSPPSLSEPFVMADPTTRIFAVEDPSVQKLWIQLSNRIRAIRPMPVFGTPTL